MITRSKILSKQIVAFTFGAFIVTMIYAGCESTPEKRIENAEEGLHEAKKEIKEAIKDARTAYRDEWHTFQFEMEAKIRDSEYRMNELKRKMVKADGKTKSKFDKEIEAVERQNENLKHRLAEYKDEGKEKWDEFKTDFAREVEIIEKSLSDLTDLQKK